MGTTEREDIAPTDRTILRRSRRRGSYNREQINQILDEALYCHVGFVHDGAPVVLPTIHARMDRELFLHGAAAGRFMGTLAMGAHVCVTATILDGLVIARSRFRCSMNYRSVLLFGSPRVVEGRKERAAALDAVVEHIIPSRVQESRPHKPAELKQTVILAMSIDEASAKIRSGDPVDDPDDQSLPIWAGVVPIRATFGSPQTSKELRDPEIMPSPSVQALVAGVVARGSTVALDET